MENKNYIRNRVADFWTFVDYINNEETERNNMEVCQLCDYLQDAINCVYTMWIDIETKTGRKEFELWENAKRRAEARHMKKCREHNVCPRECWKEQLKVMYDFICDYDLLNYGIEDYIHRIMKLV